MSPGTDPSFAAHRARYLRPLKVGITFSMLAELGLFLGFGMGLSPSGNLLHKFFWTVVFCGIGMGATVGAFIDLLVVDRWRGWRAVLACGGISLLVLGLACNLLCLNLDMNLDYFGGRSHPAVFLWSGILTAALGGLLAGWLLFTDRGEQILDRPFSAAFWAAGCSLPTGAKKCCIAAGD